MISFRSRRLWKLTITFCQDTDHFDYTGFSSKIWPEEENLKRCKLSSKTHTHTHKEKLKNSSKTFEFHILSDTHYRPTWASYRKETVVNDEENGTPSKTLSVSIIFTDRKYSWSFAIAFWNRNTKNFHKIRSWISFNMKVSNFLSHF